jgi:Ca2+-binding RTX toxin-like protein
MAIISDSDGYSWDKIVGTLNADSIQLINGNRHEIDGNGGSDTVVFFDYIDNFTISAPLAGTSIVIGLSAASYKYNYETFYLTNVRYIQFYDEIYDIDTGNSITGYGKKIFDTDETKPETIEGAAGNDIITEFFGGNDIIDGKEGTDTVIFFDSINNFKIETLSGFTQVTGLNSADVKYNGKVLKLLNIEKIKFLDSVYEVGQLLNNPPVGRATAILPDDKQTTPYIIKATDLLKGFGDPNGDLLAVSNLTATNGTFTDNGNNTWTYNPTVNQNGLVVLNYSVIDGKGGSIAATQSFNLIAVNYAPTGSATKTLPVDYQTTSYIIKTSDLVAGFDDPDVEDKGKLAVIDLAADDGKLFDNGNRTWTYIPSHNDNRTVNLTYKVTDNKSGSIGGTQHFKLEPIATLPKPPKGSSTGQSIAITQDTPYKIPTSDLLLGFSSDSGGTLNVTNLKVTNGTITNSADPEKPVTEWIYTPLKNLTGSVTLTYSVMDSNGAYIDAARSFNLIAVNDPPVGNATATLLDDKQTTPYIIKATDLLKGFSDPNNDPLIVSNLIPSSGSLVSNGNNTWTFTPSANVNNLISLTYNVSDGKGESIAATQSFNLVAAPNRSPVGSATATLPTNDQAATYIIKASDLLIGFTDPDNDLLTVKDLKASSGSLIAGANNTWTFIPADKNVGGLIGLTYKVMDTSGLYIDAAQSFNLVVLAVNKPPTGNATAVLPEGKQNVPYIINKMDLLKGFTDPEGEALSVQNLKVNGVKPDDVVANNIWKFTSDSNGVFFVTYEVTDNVTGNKSISATQSFNLVAAPNNAPTGTAKAILLPADNNQTAPYIIKATDLLVGFDDKDPGDKAALTVKDLKVSAGSLIAGANNTWTFIPAKDSSGLIGLTYNVTDNKGGSVEAAQSFTLIPVNDDPTGNPTASLPDKEKTDAPYIIKATDLLKGFSDPNGDKLEVDNLTASSGNLIDNDNNTWTFKPEKNANDTINLTYSVIDNKGGSIDATLSFQVFRVNHRPEGSATVQLPNGLQNRPYEIFAKDLLSGFYDPDGDTLSVSNLVIGGRTINANSSGGWIYIPPKNVSGEIELKYNVTDGNGGSVLAIQSFNLLEPNHLPVGDVTILGIPKIGQTLTAQNTLKDADGLGIISYQWLGNDQPINNATQSTYFVTENDLGKTLRVKASYVDVLANPESVTSQATTPVKHFTIAADNQTLKGTSKNNVLKGDNGNDTLIGALGADTLTGGEGEDVFTYNKISESGVKISKRDTITDFNQTEGDKIDLSAIDANLKQAGKQPFSFIEEEAFSSTNATGQLRFDKETHILYGSINANDKPEFAIFLNGVNTLTIDDFIL